MCITLFAYHVHPHYKLILASNRDELQVRPTANANFWEDDPDLLAGRDLEAGGTWLGIKRNGRLANVTNYRDFRIPLKQNAPSRGDLTTGFLKGTETPQQFLERLTPMAEAYNGFSVLLGDVNELAYFSNMEGKIRSLQAGVYGFSNHLLDTPWPKVEKGKAELREIAQHSDWSATDLLDIMADRTPGPDDQLPDTGRDLEFERMVSPIFIENSFYGTRASSVVLVSQNNQVTFLERNYDKNALVLSTETFSFDLE